MNNSEKIKQDIFDLYEVFYTIGENEKTSCFLGTEVLKKLKYEPDEVKKALNIERNENKKASQEFSSEISLISTREQAVKYFNDNLEHIFQTDISETEKNAVLKKVTSEELKHLYYIIFGITWKGKCKKVDILYKIKEFCEDEKRTVDLTKNLY